MWAGATAALPAQNSLRRLDGTALNPSSMAATIERLMTLGKVPGLGMAIFTGNTVAYLRAFGVRNLDSGLPLTPDTVMNAASLTNVAFVMQLVQEGALDLDRSVSEYLPDPWRLDAAFGELPTDSRFRRITARMLLSHTAGFPNLRQLNRGKVKGIGR